MWDKTSNTIRSWEDLLISGLSQLRNNIAHGSKQGFQNASSAEVRTIELLQAGEELMTLIKCNLKSF